jgi:hypothetical protein
MSVSETQEYYTKDPDIDILHVTQDVLNLGLVNRMYGIEMTEKKKTLFTGIGGN